MKFRVTHINAVVRMTNNKNDEVSVCIRGWARFFHHQPKQGNILYVSTRKRPDYLPIPIQRKSLYDWHWGPYRLRRFIGVTNIWLEEHIPSTTTTLWVKLCSN